MNILLIGSGGREHAFAMKIAESEHCDKLYVSPGNAGTALHGDNVALNVSDIDALADFVCSRNVDLLIVGPEAPLVDGLRDKLESRADTKDLMIVGPGSKGAMLEGSKDFAKDFMSKFKIPTAAYQSFTKETVEQGKTFLAGLKAPYVLKADGLAAGKGVLILDDLGEAQNQLENMICEQQFGKASETVVVEEFLDGIELSVFVATDGKDYVILPEAKDYKRIGEGDTGLNTGGMGAVSPVPFADKQFMEKVETRIVLPTVNGLKQEKIDYKGFLFLGLMNVDGDPYVIEYNVRMGDPETEVVFPRIKSDLPELMQSIAIGKLSEYTLKVDSRFATTVMMVSGGYPGAYEKGKVMHGLDAINDPDCLLIHAGTIREEAQVLTNGGRVLACTSLAESMTEALEKSYKSANSISFEKAYFRNDIGKDLITYL